MRGEKILGGKLISFTLEVCSAGDLFAKYRHLRLTEFGRNVLDVQDRSLFSGQDSSEWTK